MRNCGLLVRHPDELGIVPWDEQGDGEGAHEPAVSVVPLSGEPGEEWRCSLQEAAQGAPRLHADVEYPAIDSQVASFVPAEQPGGKVVHVPRGALDQRAGQTKRLGSVIRPGSRLDMGVAPGKAGRRQQIDLVSGGQCLRRVKLIRNPDGVTDEQAPETSFNMAERGFHQ